MDHDEHFDRGARARRYIENLRSATMHWHFIQGEEAAEAELWLSAVITLLAGIENSVRVLLRQIEGQDLQLDQDLAAVLSNPLLRAARDKGLPVEELAFAGETDFLQKLGKKAPLVEIVRVRHNLCHGNILEYVNTDLGPDSAFFTPECLRNLAHVLVDTSRRWTDAIGKFRRATGIA
jgi:hypothetical protein